MVFALAPLALAWLFAPRRPSKTKQATYECGLESKGDAWVQFRVQYYLFAILFVIFDIETIFLYPWAVAFNKLGVFALVEMAIFLAILAGGLAYAWAKGVLEWK
ncbi:MAG: NADH-quinone oxidoreductase subunit A [Verrucomicrobia bacterium]|nr:NADH-quinone oxidoreductase subunit A [Verrucomicrobiota bacterium]